eukprot:SAG22_NODE_183_length_16031_cov_36.647000_15_plen_74_part_00
MHTDTQNRFYESSQRGKYESAPNDKNRVDSDKTGGIHMDTLEHMSIHPGAVNVLSNATSVVSQNYLNDYLVFY